MDPNLTIDVVINKIDCLFDDNNDMLLINKNLLELKTKWFEFTSGYDFVADSPEIFEFIKIFNSLLNNCINDADYYPEDNKIRYNNFCKEFSEKISIYIMYITNYNNDDD